MNKDTHTQQLKEIDREQRTKQQEQQPSDTVFAEAIVESLDSNPSKTNVPLLSQEEIELEDPPRVNLTAVICTAIVAICATIILCVAQPWRSDEPETVAVEQVESDATAVAPISPEPKPTTVPEKETVAQNEPAPTTTSTVEPQQATTPQVPEQKPEHPKNDATSTLPVVKSVKTGTENPYNNIRLVDASSRLLTKTEVSQMNKVELALARNAIYARHGYQFNNTELKEFFDKQSWFKASDVKIDEIPFTQIELDNIRLIKAQEQNN